MPTPTPNRGYERPDQGAVDWDTPLNANFTKLDEDVHTPYFEFVVDPAAVNPISPAPADVQFFQWSVPAEGVYDIIAKTDIRLDPLTEPAAGTTRVEVDGVREDAVSGTLTPTAAATEFHTQTCPTKIPLQQGQVVSHEFFHRATIPLETAANTSMRISRAGPL